MTVSKKISIFVNDMEINTIVKRYKTPLRFHIMKMGVNKADAEDLVQDTFVKVNRSLHTYSKKYSFTTWLYRIATNTTIDHIRKSKSRFEKVPTIDLSELDYDDRSYYLPDNKTPEFYINKREKSKTVRDIIDTLPVKYRRLIYLRYYFGLSYNEISESLEIPLGSIKAQIFRDKQMLKTKINKNLI